MTCRNCDRLAQQVETLRAACTHALYEEMMDPERLLDSIREVCRSALAGSPVAEPKQSTPISYGGAEDPWNEPRS